MLWHHSLYKWYHIQYVGPHIHYTCDITATNQCHYSDSIDNITHTLYDLTFGKCMTSFALYKTSHPRFMTSSHHSYDIKPTIFDIVSTVSVPSHPLYWWYHTNWIFVISSAIYDDIISIVYDITATECVSSHPHFQRYNNFVCRTSPPLYVYYHLHFIKHNVQILCHHTTLFLTSHALYSWHHPHYSWNGIHLIRVIATTPLIISDQLYVWHHTHLTCAILYTLHNVTSCLYDFTPL